MYVWRAGSGGRIRIQLFFRARENVSIFWAAGPKKSEIGAVLSALDGFVVASINRQRAVRLLSRNILIRREVSMRKNETFWHDSDPWRIFSTSSRGLWAFPRALTCIYGILTSFLVEPEPACETVTSPQSEV